MTENNEAVAATDAPTLGHVQMPQFSMSPDDRAHLNQIIQTLADAVDSKRRTMGKVETMRRAKVAAQADADSARAKWSEKLRDGDGMITREVQKLRVAERSALSLVEEYEVLEAEVTKGFETLELEVAEAASLCIKAKNDALKEAAEQAYAHVIAQAGNALALAFNIYCTAENAEIPYNCKMSSDDLSARFLGRLINEVRRRSDSELVEDQVKIFLSLPPIDLRDVDAALMNSPTRRLKLRQKINAESVE